MISVPVQRPVVRPVGSVLRPPWLGGKRFDPALFFDGGYVGDAWGVNNTYMSIARDGTGGSPGDADPVGRMVGVVNGGYATAPTDAARALFKISPDRINHDLSDDNYVYDGTGLGDCDYLHATRYGFMVSTGNISGDVQLARHSNLIYSLIINKTLSANEKAQLASYLGVSEYAFIGTTNDLTIFHKFGTGNKRFIGANGVIYDTTADNVTTDLAAEGLTAPVTLLVSTVSGTNIQYYNNQLTGSIPILPASLIALYAHLNQLTGSIPALPASLTTLQVNNNQLTGSIPALPASLAVLFCYFNQLTGSIPTLPASLTSLRCNNNNLTGSIPPLPASLTTVWCYANQLTGSIPAIPPSLQNFYGFNNLLTDYTPSTIPTSLVDFQAQNNLLIESAVNQILIDFDTAGFPAGVLTLNLGGTGNAAPTGAGLTAKANLIANSQSVTTN